MKKIIFFCLLFACAQNLFAAVNCTGTTLFTEQNCTGDEISPAERELHRIINEYRAQNNQPPVMISEPLSFVANRHLLDLTLNVKYLTHGWSNCPYDIKRAETWNCLFESPQRLKSSYTGQGFENLYRNLNGAATPALALEAWKKSQMHNNLILNLDIWKNTKYDAFGVAIEGNYAAIWFGSTGNQTVNLGKEIKGLGVTYDQLTKGLNSVLSIEKTSSLAESAKWVGKSADNSIKLEIYGRESDIAETSMSFSVKLDKKFQLTPQGRAALLQFLKNLSPEWTEREKWTDAALQKIGKAPKSNEAINVKNKTIQLKINAENYLTVIAKPNQKPLAVEF